MYDIRQFKPMLYTLVILGISGFALAWEAPGLWVLTMAAIGLNAWLVKTDRFIPMPRIIANLATLLGVLLLVMFARHGSEKIYLSGEFLVLLQIIKLYEQRANRDYSQLLVLSLLLMVAAAISTASLIFGVMLIVYLFLSLYCCLLFHLKVETDHARQAIGFTDRAALQQDERHLSRSIRRLTTTISLISVTVAVVIFVFFPRGQAAGIFGQPWQASQTLTGFNDKVNFQTVAAITQNTQSIAWVKVTQNNQPYKQIPLLLRGLTLDRYTGKGDDENNSAYEWIRTVPELSGADIGAGQSRTFGQGTRSSDDLFQEVILNPTGTSVLFAIAGVVSFRPEQNLSIRYASQDQVLRSADSLTQQIRYQVVSRGTLTAAPSQFLREHTTPNIDPKIEQYARLPEVSGSDARGSLAPRRSKAIMVSPLDATIARNIEKYLRSNFTYTLDLTDAARIAGQDPMVAFLYNLKRGHCEYFAGAMTLMCQSLGMQARMVVGFKCDDFNSIGNYYTVRQSHAHAWVEVLDLDGRWETFDPTSSTETVLPPVDTWTQKARKFADFLQYSWANAVIAYDTDSRDNLIQTVDRTLVNVVVHGSDNADQFSKWLDLEKYFISSSVIAGVIAIMLIVLFFAVLWFLLEQLRLRRRARRIGLDALPTDQQKQLAKQLGFYDDLLLLLERHDIFRPEHLTPLEFSDSLTFLPSDAFDAIQQLTDAFYIVRFGHAQLNATQRRSLLDILTNVESSLGAH